jgi:succinoglycan biosynthesis transport protein ExoP
LAGTREEPSDPRTPLRHVWRYRWVLIAVALGIPALVYIVSSLLPKTYEATATIQVPSQSTAERAAEFLQTRTSAKRAARELDASPEQAEALLADITATAAAPPRTGSTTGPKLLSITAEADAPERAAEIANAFAGVKLAAGPESPEIPVVVVERATRPDGPAAPEPLRNTAVAFVFSILLAGGLGIVLTAFDRRLRDPGELEAMLDRPLLATVPETEFAARPAEAAAEPFQMLRANLTYLNPDRALRTVVVVSPGADEGTTTVAVNLARAAAEADLDVVLVDADLRKSSVTRRLDLEPPYGLEDVLVNGKGLDDALVDVDVDTESGRLRVLSAGAPPANPSALLGSAAMRSFLTSISESTDLVVVDTPPLLAVGDAVPLLAQASGVLLVARLDSTGRDGVRRAAELIAAARGTLLGGVVTGTGTGPFGGDAYGYGYRAARSDAARNRANGANGGRLRRVYERIRRRSGTGAQSDRD